MHKVIGRFVIGQRHPPSGDDGYSFRSHRCQAVESVYVRIHRLATMATVFVAIAAKRWKAFTFASTVWRRWLRSLPSGAVQVITCSAGGAMCPQANFQATRPLSAKE